MGGGQINCADLSFLCNNDCLQYWLKRIIKENDKNSNDNEVMLESMEQTLPISVLGTDGILFVLLKYFDNLTYLNRDHLLITDKVNKIINDVLLIYNHLQDKQKYHETICSVINFIIRKCAEYGNRSNGLKFGGDDMLKIMCQISEIGIAGKPMIYD